MANELNIQAGSDAFKAGLDLLRFKDRVVTETTVVRRHTILVGQPVAGVGASIVLDCGIWYPQRDIRIVAAEFHSVSLSPNIGAAQVLPHVMAQTQIESLLGVPIGDTAPNYQAGSSSSAGNYRQDFFFMSGNPMIDLNVARVILPKVADVSVGYTITTQVWLGPWVGANVNLIGALIFHYVEF